MGGRGERRDRETQEKRQRERERKRESWEFSLTVLEIRCSSMAGTRCYFRYTFKTKPIKLELDTEVGALITHELDTSDRLRPTTKICTDCRRWPGIGYNVRT